MKRSEIISKVKVRMDELTPFDEGLIITDPNSNLIKPIDAYIDEMLDECVVDVFKAFPLYMLDVFPMDGTRTNHDGVIHVELPDDFCRIAMVLFDAWKRPVHYALTSEHPNYIKQFNPYTRGGVTKPVVLIQNDDTGIPHIECYSVPSGSTDGVVSYVPRVKAEELEREELIDPLTWLCASKVLAIMGSKEAEIAMAHYLEILKKSLHV